MGFFGCGFDRCCDRCKGFACGCGCGFGGFEGCGRRCDRDDKKISIITAVRAVCAQGDGCFDKIKW